MPDGAAAALDLSRPRLAIITSTFRDAKERASGGRNLDRHHRAGRGAWTDHRRLAAPALLVGLGLLRSIPIAAVALGLGHWLVPTSRDPSAPKLDTVGFALSIAGIGAIVYSIIEAPGRGWTNQKPLPDSLLGIALLVVFVVWERRVDQPMLDVTIFSNIRFSAASLSIMVAFFGLFGFIFLITQYFQLIKGYDPLSAGVHTLPFAIVTGAASPFAPVLASRFGTKLVVPLGLLAMSAGFALASTVNAGTAYFGPVIISMALMAVGLALVAAPCTAAILAVLPPAKAGVGSAINDVARELGGTFGVAVVGAVFSSVFAAQIVDRLRQLGLSSSALVTAKTSVVAAISATHSTPHANAIIAVVRLVFRRRAEPRLTRVCRGCGRRSHLRIRSASATPSGPSRHLRRSARTLRSFPTSGSDS